MSSTTSMSMTPGGETDHTSTNEEELESGMGEDNENGDGGYEYIEVIHIISGEHECLNVQENILQEVRSNSSQNPSANIEAWRSRCLLRREN